MRNQIPIPALRKLNRPINSPHNNHQKAQRHGRAHRPHAPRNPRQERAPSRQHPLPKVDHKPPKQQHRKQLKRNSGHHDMRPRLLLGARVRLARQGAAGGLRDERDQVARTEDDGVPLGGDDGGGAAERQDELAEEHVERRGEEDGRDDQGDFLCEECVAVVRAFAAVGAGGPSDEFGCGEGE